jgi:hypothetical protein
MPIVAGHAQRVCLLVVVGGNSARIQEAGVNTSVNARGDKGAQGRSSCALRLSLRRLPLKRRRLHVHLDCLLGLE